MPCCRGKGGDFPPGHVLATNAAKAAGRIVGAALRGDAVKVSSDENERRLAICRACQNSRPYYRDPQYIRCIECGCWLNGRFFAKASLATETCPLGKWGES